MTISKMKTYVLVVIAILSCFSAKVLAQSNFANDLEFIRQFDAPIVLKSEDEQSQIVLSAQHQGRVLTSSATGLQGISNAWLNRDAIKTKKGNVGGEDRTWIAPIGSKFSLFYPAGKAIKSENWRVPPALQAKDYLVVSQNSHSAHFQKNLDLVNYQNTAFSARLDRKITLLSAPEIAKSLDVTFPKTVNQVGYPSFNSLTNIGDDWNIENGLITIWSLAMLQGSDDNISMFAIKPEQAPAQSYLYPLYGDRLISKDHLVFYKTDGKYRSKIGIPAAMSKDLMLSYAPSLNRLTVIKFSLAPAENYPISLEQADTTLVKGDVTNAYNHGNMDGSLLDDSAFFELESAAPMLALKTNGSVTHTQQVVHFIGTTAELDLISSQLIGINVSQTQNIFKP
jgi:hypothetical protein